MRHYKLIISILILSLALTLSGRSEIKKVQAQVQEEYPVQIANPEESIQLPNDSNTEVIQVNPENSMDVMELESYKQGERIVVGEDEVIDRDFFAAGETIQISGTINGDAYVAGGKVIVDGVINGDLLTAGGDVDISGTVTQDIRAAGGHVRIAAVAGRNVTIAGGTVNFDPSANLHGNVVVVGGTVSMNAAVPGDATFGVGDLTLGSQIEGSVHAGVGQLWMLNDASVAGDFVLFADEDIQIDQTKVAGNVIRKDVPHTEKSIPAAEVNPEEVMKSIFTFFTVVSLIAQIIIGLLLVYAMPHFMRKTSETLQTQPWKSIGIGLVIMFVTPIASIALLFTLVGFPLGIFALIFFTFGLYLSQYFVMYWLGRLIVQKLDKKWNDGWIFMVGLVVFNVVKMIPVVGWVAHVIALLAGYGAFASTKAELVKYLRKKKHL